MPDPLEGFKPVKDDPLAGFKPVVPEEFNKPYKAPEPEKPYSPEEFAQFIAGEDPRKTLATNKKKLQLRTMPRSLISTPEDLAVAYGIDTSKISPYDLNQAFQEFQASQKKGKATGAFDALIRGIKEGVAAPARGIEQGVSRAFAGLIPSSPGLQSSAELSDLSARMTSDVYGSQTAEHPYAAGTGKVLGELPYAAVLPGGPISGAAKKAPAIGRAALGGAMAGAAQPIVDPSQSRLGNVAAGAIMAPLAQVGLEAGISGLTKLKASLPGSNLPAQYDVIQREIRSAGMEPTAADLVTNPTSNVSKLRDIIANAPFGNFAKQNEANKIAAGQLINNMVSVTRKKIANETITARNLLEELSQRTPQRAPNPETVRALGNLSDYANSSNQAYAGSVLQADMLGNKYNFASKVKDLYAPANDAMPSISINLEEPLTEAQRLLNSIKSGGKLGKDRSLERDLQRAVADLTPEKPLDLMGTTQSPGSYPVLSYPGQEAPSGGSDHLGMIVTGKAPVIGGGLPQQEERDIYGTVIKGALPGRAPDGTTPPKGVTPAPTFGSFGYGPVAPESASSGMSHTPASIDRFLKTLRELRDQAYESGRNSAGEAYKSLIEKTELARNTEPRLVDYLAKKFAADEQKAAGINMFNAGGGTRNIPGERIQGLTEVPPDQMIGELKKLSAIQTRELGKTYGPAGRSAHFHMLVDDIVNEAATNRATPEFQFQRGAFLDKLKGAKGAIGEVATPLEKSQIDSLERVFQHMDQIDKTEFKQPNYTRWIWSQPNVLLKPLLTTDWGKRMLLTLSASRVGSPAEKRVLQALEQRLPQIVSMSGGNAGNPVNEIPNIPEDEQP